MMLHRNDQSSYVEAKSAQSVCVYTDVRRY